VAIFRLYLEGERVLSSAGWARTTDLCIMSAAL
jgi:hypothetical protein